MHSVVQQPENLMHLVILLRQPSLSFFQVLILLYVSTSVYGDTVSLCPTKIVKFCTFFLARAKTVSCTTYYTLFGPWFLCKIRQHNDQGLYSEFLRLYPEYVSVYNTVYVLYIKIAYCQGDMFRPSLGHLQALKENRSKITQIFYKNALWDPKCSQDVL